MFTEGRIPSCHFFCKKPKAMLNGSKNLFNLHKMQGFPVFLYYRKRNFG